MQCSLSFHGPGLLRDVSLDKTSSIHELFTKSRISSASHRQIESTDCEKLEQSFLLQLLAYSTVFLRSLPQQQICPTVPSII